MAPLPDVGPTDGANDAAGSQPRIACAETASGPKVKRAGGGVDVRIGMFQSGDFDQPGRSPIPATPDPTIGLGIFVDVAAMPKLRARFGLRAKLIKARWTSNSSGRPMGTCPASTTCASSPSGLFAGPAVSIEPALYRDATSDVHFLLGAALAIPLGGANFKLKSDGNEMPGPRSR